MPVLKYRDPVDQQWKPVSYGGTGGGPVPNEVLVSSTPPADPEVELWLDSGATGPAEDFVNVTGDTMTGNLVMNDMWAEFNNGGVYWSVGDHAITVHPTQHNNQIAVVTGAAGSLLPIHVADPVAPTHAATKAYVDRDTEWLDITGLLVSPWTGSAGIRRCGSMVYIWASVSSTVMSSSNVILPIDGFMGTADTIAPVWSTTTATWVDLQAYGGSTVGLAHAGILTGFNDQRLDAVLSWSVGNSPWPTTLPGSPAATGFGLKNIYSDGQP